MRAMAASIAACALALISASAREMGAREATQSAPQRDARTTVATTPSPTATGSIAGTVLVDDESSRPLRRATVTLSAGQLELPRSTVTDDAGRFLFTALEPGNYTVSAQRAAYVTAYFGGKRPGRPPGTPIAVQQGQRVSDITIRIMRGGVITGTIRQTNASPLSGARVTATPMQSGTARPQPLLELMGLQTTMADDRGMYRIFGLPPGEYAVSAQSALGLGASEARRITPEEVRWAEQSTSQPGAGLSVAPLTPAPAGGPRTAYAPIYYPATADPKAASLVTISHGEERAGIDVTLLPVPTATITGQLLDPDGRPMPNVTVTLQQAQVNDFTDIITSVLGRGGARTTADGRFTITSVVPGQYTLRARAAPPKPPAAPPPGAGGAGGLGAVSVGAGGMAPNAEAMAMMASMLPGGGAGLTLWAAEDVSVNGQDLQGITLRLQPGMTVSGKMQVQAATLTPPTDFSRARITIASATTGTSPGDVIAAMTSASFGTVNADGTFKVEGVVPGSYRASVLMPGVLLMPGLPGGTGFVLKSAMVNGRDVADLPLEIKPNGPVSDMVITLTDRITEISGRLSDGLDRPVSTFPIVVFSTSPEYWLPGARRVQQARPASDGRYRVTGLPPGEYYISAATDVDEAELYESSFLNLLVTGAFKITLGDGEKKVQDLRLSVR